MKQLKFKLHLIYHAFVNSWYQPRWWNYCLLPATLVFYVIILGRKSLYKFSLCKRYKSTVPIIIVGNLTVGGTGKTPLVIYLVEQLAQHGYRPVVISRGYGRTNHDLQFVTASSSVYAVGDEPLLMAKRNLCPVIVSYKRVLAIQAALAKTNCNLIICDDGLQDYTLASNIEIIVLDGIRRLGNSMLLPAGPLREPVKKLTRVDFVINNGGDKANEISMQISVDTVVNLLTDDVVSLASFTGQTVHAIAGIGHPLRFFNSLLALGIKVIPHAFPDHYFYTAADLNFNDALPILMTEKDMLKCASFAHQNMYYVTVTTHIANTFMQQLMAKLPPITSS